MKRWTIALLLATALSAGALAAGRTDPRPRHPNAATPAEAWRALGGASGHGCGKDLVFDYGAEGGLRNFFCRALTVFRWKTFLSLAPVRPFLSGPHHGGKLNLQAEKTFGHYDPQFVRWATDALIPAAKDPALRQQTQLVYDSQARTLARTYYEVFRVLTDAPEWTRAERAAYLAAVEAGAAEPMGQTLDLYHDVLGGSGSSWGGHDPNHVRSAVTWWFRRYQDETAPLWADGLERLLNCYDEAWLSTRRKRKPPAPPPRAPTPSAPGGG